MTHTIGVIDAEGHVVRDERGVPVPRYPVGLRLEKSVLDGPSP
jgi:hypothetical protein